MLDSITIKKFKAIQSEDGLTLNNLDSVNYLVGKNGSGKSSVLEGINTIKVRKYNLPRTDFTFHTPENIIASFQLKSETNAIVDSEFVFEKFLSDNLYFFLLIFCSVVIINSEIFIISFWNKFLIILSISFFSYPVLKSSSKSKLKIYNFTEIFNLNLKTKITEPAQIHLIENILKDSGLEFENIEKDIITIDSKTHNKEDKSAGENHLIDLISTISLCPYELVLIEEPEKFLHPKFQKKLPRLFSNISRIYNKQMIITVHSPFIISAAAEFYDSQKVYLIKDGQTVDLEGNLGKGSEGYSGGECILAANEMLGSNVDSLSSAVVFCEKSLSIILEDVVKRNKSKRNFTFSSMGGGGDNSIYENLVKAYKFNVNNLSIYAIIDKDENVNKIIEKDKSCIINNSIPIEQRKDCIARNMASNSIFVSEYSELEDFYDIIKVNKFLISKNYQKWDKSTNQFFAKGYCKNNFDKDFKSGELKLELAEYMKQHIDKSHIKLFCPKLYDLIFTNGTNT